MFRQLFIAIFFLASFSNINGDFMFSYDNKNEYFEPETASSLRGGQLNTTSYVYTYSQSGHHFYGPAYDGSYIDTTGCCSGQSGSCRNNPSCQCQVSVGPLP
jgi:hypothetical protein